MSWINTAHDEFCFTSVEVERLRSLDEFGEVPGELLLDIIHLYLELTPKAILSLVTAIKKNQIQQVFEIAHGLKSSSANVGAMRLAGLCQTLEAQTEPKLRSQISNFDSVFLEIENEFSCVSRELKLVEHLVKSQDVRQDVRKGS